MKSTTKYQTKGDFQLKEEQIQAAIEKGTGLFKAVEAYLWHTLISTTKPCVYIDINIEADLRQSDQRKNVNYKERFDEFEDERDVSTEGVEGSFYRVIRRLKEKTILYRILLTFTEGNLLDGSRSSISFNYFSGLNGLRCNLWDEVVGIYDKGLEKPSWGDSRGVLRLISEDTHDDFKSVL
ncbi:major allergen pru ar 1 [Quercus suber]|uniref:Major allergen pru ar 1 n=1 Tax=Quercus suber TaxID=58331 RepID=A0AAW0KLA9_QUESU